VSGLVEVLEISSQFQQELLGKSVAHDGSILYMSTHKCKVTRIGEKFS
jgi:hypothetical protein